MKQRKKIVACLLAGLVFSIPAGMLSHAAEYAEQQLSQEPEISVLEDSNLPEGYTGIYTAADFSKIAENPEGNYILMEDLNLEGETFSGIEVFSGVFDGNAHTISGLKTALFQVIEKGSVYNLKLSNVQIQGDKNAAALAAVIGSGQEQKIEIQNICITGEISGTENAGALAGLVTGNNILLKGIANSAQVNAEMNAGGLIGQICVTDEQENEAKIILAESYNIGEVKAGILSAGLVGMIEIPNRTMAGNLEIMNCYNAGILEKGANIAGKIVAGNGKVLLDKCLGIQMYYSDADGMIGSCEAFAGSTQTTLCSMQNCYYYSMNPVYAFASGENITGTAIALDDVQIKKQSSFRDFDFDEVWGIVETENEGYPYLKQTERLSVQYTVPTAGTLLMDSKTEGKYKVLVRSQSVAYAGVMNEELQSITIPSQVEINGISYQVTQIAEKAWKDNTTIKYVSIPDSVTEIGKQAWKNCTSLLQVSGCKKVKKIYQEAFCGCKNLTTIGSTNYRITLPSIEMIGIRAFKNVESVRKVYITSQDFATIKKGAFRGCNSLKKFNTKSKNLNKIQAYAFYGDSNLKTIIIHSEKLSSSSVGNKVFYGIKKTATFKVPVGSLSEYTVIFQQKGAGSKFKIKSI